MLKRQDFLDAYTWRVAQAYKDHPVDPSERVRLDTEEYVASLHGPSTNAASAFATAHFQVTGVGSDYVTSQQISEILSRTGQAQLLQAVKTCLISAGGKPDENCGRVKIKRKEKRGTRGIKYVKLKAEV